MPREHYLLSLRFIRETEIDLTMGLRCGTPILEQYEQLLAELREVELVWNQVADRKEPHTTAHHHPIDEETPLGSSAS